MSYMNEPHLKIYPRSTIISNIKDVIESNNIKFKLELHQTYTLQH